MSTNYYLALDEKELHIGKSSMGWCFALHVIPEMNLNNLDDWIRFIVNNPSCKIYDEYGYCVQLEQLIETIAGRWRKQGPGFDFNFVRNNAEMGPNNLLRRKISHHCVDHGIGTWDLIIGEFS